MLSPLGRLAAVLACAFTMLVGITPIIGMQTAEASSTSCLPGAIKQRLAQIRSKFGPVRVVSTFRRGARIAGSGRRSYHANCRAVDFHAPRGKHRAVVAWLKANHGGGVGTYSCGMSHIHIDNGPHVRFHHCVGKGGHRHASRKRRGGNYASRTRSRSATRTASRSAGRPRITSQAARRAPKRLAQPKKLHFDVNSYALVN
jgi:hypothetical protein